MVRPLLAFVGSFQCRFQRAVTPPTMDDEKTLARISEHLEEDHVERAVMGCLRIARHAKDHFPAAIFLRELYQRHNFLAERKDALERWGAHVRKILTDASNDRGNTIRRVA
jgi:hypothetical protein